MDQLTKSIADRTLSAKKVRERDDRLREEIAY